jgi:hypothetical protein
MLSTYQAILRGEVVEWLADKPDHLTPDRAVAVYVTILEEAPPLMMTERGLRMAAALDQLAQMQGAIASLDPLQSERELRQERDLPGRENDAD